MKDINSDYLNPMDVIKNAPHDIPFELLIEILSWGKIIKSPYGHSYYDAPVGWDFKTDKSLRISNHWNFISNNKKHCVTDKPVRNNTHWTIARFNTETGKYTPIKSIPKLRTPIKLLPDYHKLLNDLRNSIFDVIEKSIVSNNNLNKVA